MALNLGIDHVVAWIRERRLHFLHRRKPQLHRVSVSRGPLTSAQRHLAFERIDKAI